jgi:hypothetical protein
VSLSGLFFIFQKKLHFPELTVSTVTAVMGLLAGLFSSYLAMFAKRLRVAPRVFLSYSRESEGIAKDVAEALRSHGARVWMDVERLKAGDQIELAIERAIGDADTFVVLLTDQQSNFSKYELGLARSKGLRVIPVLFRDVTVPVDLKDIQYVDLRRDFDSGLRELVRAAT